MMDVFVDVVFFFQARVLEGAGTGTGDSQILVFYLTHLGGGEIGRAHV